MKIPHIELVFVGTELLTGKVNTHAAFLGSRLSDIGLSVAREHTVGDDPAMMKPVFSEAWRRSDLVLCAGGLGPTFDDITRDVWSRVLRRPLVEKAALVTEIERKFKGRGIPMPPMNRRQAEVLKGAFVLNNPHGTAPGQMVSMGSKTLVLLPGPARELMPMYDTQVGPRLKKLFSHRHRQTKTFLMVGVPESQIDQLVRPLIEKTKAPAGVRLVHGILASQSIISVKFSVDGPAPEPVQQWCDALTRSFRSVLRDYLFGEDGDTLESVVGRHLRERRATVSVAESCTGGLVAKMLTDVEGSSAYFMESATVYHNAAKQRRLGVPSALLKKYGAVSEAVARSMAEGMRTTANTTFALSLTGLAGPAGGTGKKPVGLVYIGCAGPGGTLVKEFRFKGDRAFIRHRAAVMALDMLRRRVLAR